jgi:hypothetical protein
VEREWFGMVCLALVCRLVLCVRSQPRMCNISGWTLLLRNQEAWAASTIMGRVCKVCMP